VLTIDVNICQQIERTTIHKLNKHGEIRKTVQIDNITPLIYCFTSKQTSRTLYSVYLVFSEKIRQERLVCLSSS
jgi:hypothetical protein